MEYALIYLEVVHSIDTDKWLPCSHFAQQNDAKKQQSFLKACFVIGRKTPVGKKKEKETTNNG